MDLEPQELLPAMPPMVQRAWVEGSTGKNRSWPRRAAVQVAQNEAWFNQGGSRLGIDM